MASRIEADEALTIELHFALHPTEARKPLRTILQGVIGDIQVRSALDKLDPTFAIMGVEPMGSTMADIRSGSAHLPTSGYYGSELVRLFGKDELSKALRGCPEYSFLGSGGIFLCWEWESSKIFRTDAFRSYSSMMTILERRIGSSTGQ